MTSPGVDRPIPFRPHHLLCVLCYGGAGYTEEFVCNLDRIAERLSSGNARLLIVEGPDQICDPMMKCREHPDFHCEDEGIRERDARALEDLRRALAAWSDPTPGAPPQPASLDYGDIVTYTPALVAHLRALFASNAIRSACPGCEWHPRCTARAESGFEGSRVQPR